MTAKEYGLQCAARGPYAMAYGYEYGKRIWIQRKTIYNCRH